MTDPSRELAVEGIRFFGEMTASISHEIKNVLAIINENAGLLNDLVAMGGQGRPLSLERLQRLGDSIERQVKRGDGIVKNLNRFAHSADHAAEAVDVGAVIHFVVDLASRLIAMKGRVPQVQLPSTPVMVDTNRFFLENLIWTCMSRAMAASSADPPVSIIVEKREAGARIRFRPSTDGGLDARDDFPSSGTVAAARMINVQITVETNANEIILSI